MNMNRNKIALACAVAAAVAIGAGGAYAAASPHARPTSAPTAAAVKSQRANTANTALASSIASLVATAVAPAGADTTNATHSVTNLHDLVREAIAKAVADGHISKTEADLADLFLNGAVRPDLALRNAWRPVVQAAADALGVSVAALQVDLANGESLAEIAHQRGRSPAAVAEAIEAASKTALATAVADRAVTAAGSADILDLLRTHLRDVLSLRP